MPLRLLREDEANIILRDPSFQNDWFKLAAACPWSTSCQSWAFADAWFVTYADTYEPLLLVERDSLGSLSGLFVLAFHRSTGHITHVGAHQAEYQVWLAGVNNSDAFIESALDELAKAFPGKQLKLQYLPPGSPIDWCGRLSRWGSQTVVREKKLPLLSVGLNSTVEQSLRKKSNKSRMNRLQKLAPLRFVQVDNAADLASMLDDIADYCDLRQGAINSVFPFRDDPQKKNFCLRMMEKPGLLHASALILGDNIIAANIGQINRSSVSIGILCHSPFMAEHSPGKIHLLLLARELGRQGFSSLDLTAGGDAYKERSADHYDRVHVANIYFDRADYSSAKIKSHIKDWVSQLASPHTKMLARKIKRIVDLNVLAKLSAASNALMMGFYRSNKARTFSISAHEARQVEANRTLKLNSVSDLLNYRPSRKHDRTKDVFLRGVSRRLEAGDCVYTLAENGTLLYCAWITRNDSTAPPAMANHGTHFAKSCLLWDDYVHPTVNFGEVAVLSILQRLKDAAAMDGIETIFVAVGNGTILPESIKSLLVEIDN